MMLPKAIARKAKQPIVLLSEDLMEDMVSCDDGVYGQLSGGFHGWESASSGFDVDTPGTSAFVYPPSTPAYPPPAPAYPPTTSIPCTVCFPPTTLRSCSSFCFEPESKVKLDLKEEKEPREPKEQSIDRVSNRQYLAEKVRLTLTTRNDRPQTRPKTSSRLVTNKPKVNFAGGNPSLQIRMPFLTSQKFFLMEKKAELLEREQQDSGILLCIKSSCELSLTSSGDSVDLKEEQERDRTKDIYYGIQMHLINMLLVPKSLTSMRLNQQKGVRTSLEIFVKSLEREYTKEDYNKDSEAAKYLKRSYTQS
ncbi:hypothetical protein KR009_008931 [Drosophila setifemur]|nr:hypothetical protein KR009_008931 [Drosophila setifemur]